MGHRILVGTWAFYLIFTNLIWIAYDTRPPFWDMAAHQGVALRIYDAFTTTGFIEALGSIAEISGYYPPLYQSVVALFYWVLGASPDAALWANLPAILLLMAATYGIGRTLLSPLSAGMAAVLVSAYPLMLWLSREAMLDYWLTSIVALAMWILIARGFEDWRWAVAFGVACGLGMLTKWTFAFFVALPYLWVARKNWRNAAIAAAGGILVAATWYWPQAGVLLEFLGVNTAGGIGEGDPERLSVQAFVFYVRALAGYQLFIPLFVLFLAGAVRLARRFDPAWIPVLAWIVSGWAALMLFQNKDPRYTVPFLPAIALVTAKVFEQRRYLVVTVLPFLVFQHYLVTFGVSALPERVVLMEGVEGPLSYHWNLYEQTYFDLWGRPAREDWKIQYVLDRVTLDAGGPVRLGIVPDIPRFDPPAFEFYIALEKRPVVVNRLWVFDESVIAGNDFILVTDGSFGTPGSFLYTPDRERIAQYLIQRPESFRVIDSFMLPSGEWIRLYQVRAGVE